MSDNNEMILFLAKQLTRRGRASPDKIMALLAKKMNPCTPASTEALWKVINLTLNDNAHSTPPKCDHRYQWLRGPLTCSICGLEWPA